MIFEHFLRFKYSQNIDSRSFLNASYRSLLHSYVLSDINAQPTPALISLLESPRARAVDLSYLDDGSGKSLLHEAARRKDLRLIELVVRAGADVFVRDRRGKMAYDGLGRDDRVRVFLRQCMFPSLFRCFIAGTSNVQLQITILPLLMHRFPSPQY